MSRLACTLGLSLFASACNVDPYCLNCAEPDATVTDTGPRMDSDFERPDAIDTDGCVVTTEVCDLADNDCDGNIDEGELPEVGQPCGTDEGPCVQGTFECTDGMLVCGGAVVSPAAESCNGIDDDCDGTVDNGDPGGGIPCGSDIGECVKGITLCEDGDIVCTGGTGGEDEECDARDNDCDELIDEGNPGGGEECDPGTGGCALGALRCAGGEVVCVGGGAATSEVCDGVDNDCDDDVDETFDTTSDTRNCGGCDLSCTRSNAFTECADSECVIAACESGYYDLDDDVANGCEYECDFQGAETCNGADDDCDMATDEGLSAPSICAAAGACSGTTAECEGTMGWTCDYPGAVSIDSDGDIIPEFTCDGIDNDCDGASDDTFSTKGDACTRGIGACTQTGTVVCNSTEDAVECDADDPPDGTDEECNGVDDDCDGDMDEDAPDEWVTITGSFGTTEIYAYEASRPDATDTTTGVTAHRPCSQPDRLPWATLTHDEAEEACDSIGARLCTEDEWQRACQTAASTPCEFSYASSCTTYQPNVCNGNDLDHDSLLPGDQDEIVPTGSLADCYANWAGDHIFDLSGNVKEWTDERSSGINPLRGGAMNTPKLALSCDHDFVVGNDTFLFANVGFRCCR